MWVLWAYCPRRMVARPGQHRGEVEVAVVNFTPWLVMLFFKAGIMFAVPGKLIVCEDEDDVGPLGRCGGHRSSRANNRDKHHHACQEHR